jgi:anti-sigma-K factor RskA
MKLIPEWRSAWRWYSVQALAIIAALPIVWASLPPEWQAEVPSEWIKVMVVVVAIAGILGRVLQQPGVPGDAGNAS